jgi:hypothetical protein
MSSLDGPGFSVTLLKLTDDMVTFLDCDVEAVGWPVQRISSNAAGGRTFGDADQPMVEQIATNDTARGSLTGIIMLVSLPHGHKLTTANSVHQGFPNSHVLSMYLPDRRRAAHHRL